MTSAYRKLMDKIQFCSLAEQDQVNQQLFFIFLDVRWKKFKSQFKVGMVSWSTSNRKNFLLIVMRNSEMSFLVHTQFLRQAMSGLLKYNIIKLKDLVKNRQNYYTFVTVQDSWIQEVLRGTLRKLEESFVQLIAVKQSNLS